MNSKSQQAGQFVRLCRAWSGLSRAKRLYIFYLILTDRLRTLYLPSMLKGMFTYWAIYTLVGGDMLGSMVAVPVACLVVAIR